MIKLQGQRNGEEQVARNVRITGKRWHNHLNAEIAIDDYGARIPPRLSRTMEEGWSDKFTGAKIRSRCPVSSSWAIEGALPPKSNSPCGRRLTLVMCRAEYIGKNSVIPTDPTNFADATEQ
jgi:hypothetical protein